MRLDNLQNHRVACYYNPDAEVTCDKGCNLKLTRREYQDVDCREHFTNRVSCQQAQIMELKKEVQLHCREKENAKNLLGELNAKILQQQDQINHLMKVVNNPIKLFLGVSGSKKK